ncbi:MAG: hypothetical protein QF535_08380, partial [Anaerolineales bacterium]|nr:hypothetical protein [Anaerolineales bacterium]
MSEIKKSLLQGEDDEGNKESHRAKTELKKTTSCLKCITWYFLIDAVGTACGYIWDCMKIAQNGGGP